MHSAYTPARSRLRSTICLVLAQVAIFAAASADAVDLGRKIEFHIPPQKLSSALIQFSRQAQVQIVSGENFGEQITDGINGRYAIGAALTQLLGPVGLGYRPVGESSITIGKPEQIRSVGQADDPAALQAVRLAQEGQGSSQSSSASPSQDASASARTSNGGARGTAIEEIIVTAQKRAENVQDVPASITVLGGEQLSKMSATRLSDYAGYVPGLQVDNGGTPGQTRITLRGISALSPTAVVGSYIDDAPLGSSSGLARAIEFGLDLLPYDIERVEILRGPQGTLYGASTMGGLIKYVTHSPDLDQFSMRAQGEVTSIDGAGDMGWGVRTGLNAPLVDGKLALRASYFKESTPGYLDNGLTGRKDEGDVDQQGGRLALLWQLTDAVSLKLAAMLQDIDAQSRSQVQLDPLTLQPIYGRLETANALESPFEQRLRFYTATLNWDLGWADFTSATSYGRTTSTQTQDTTDAFAALIPLLTQDPTVSGFTPLTVRMDLDKITQEFRLASPGGGRVEWLAGAFYTDEDNDNSQIAYARDAAGRSILNPTFNPFTGQPLVDASGNPVLVDPLAVVTIPSTYRERAVFGNLTYRFTDTFDVTAGLRWAQNTQDFRQESQGALSVAVGAPPLALGDSDEDVITYMVSPRFHVNDDVMIYGRVASGYRPGGPNIALAGVPPQVEADELINYELGLKAQLAERVLLDIAVFHIDWKDIQLTVPAPGGISFGENGGKARSQGLEFSTAYSPVRGLRLGLNAAYTDATLTEDVPELSGVSGDRLPSSSRWAGSVTADYEVPVFADWTARFGAGYRYVGDRYSEIESDPTSILADPYDVVDLNAALFNARWTLRLVVKNATNEFAYLTPTAVPDAFGGISRVDTATLQPRTVGLSVDLKF